MSNTQPFQWDDNNVKDFCEYVGLRVGKNTDIREQISILAEDFKSTHTSGLDEGGEWEILEGKSTNGGEIHPWETDTHPAISCERNGCSIHSVKRKSDNEVFSIGDSFAYLCSETAIKIIEFKIQHGKMWVKEKDGWANLEAIFKAPQETKPVFFVTRDGKEIREGDEYWTVCDKEGYAHLTWIPIPNKAWGYNEPLGKHLYSFSTEQAANEYVIMNRPLMSVQDVMNRLQGYFKSETEILAFENLKHFSSQRIKGGAI